MGKDRGSVISQACRKFNYEGSRIIDILREVQSRLCCVDGESMELLAEELSSYRVEIEGLVTFYSFFSEERKGKIIVRLCDDIVDRFSGIDKVAKVFSDELGIGIGETSSDGNFSLEYTPCIGMSDHAPAALINEVVVTNLTPKSARTIARNLKKNLDTSKLVKKNGDGNNAAGLVNSMVRNNIRKKGAVLLADKISAGAGLKRALQMKPEEVVREAS